MRPRPKAWSGELAREESDVVMNEDHARRIRPVERRRVIPGADVCRRANRASRWAPAESIEDPGGNEERDGGVARRT